MINTRPGEIRRRERAEAGRRLKRQGMQARRTRCRANMAQLRYHRATVRSYGGVSFMSEVPMWREESGGRKGWRGTLHSWKVSSTVSVFWRDTGTRRE